jgi:hypothetical protein
MIAFGVFKACGDLDLLKKHPDQRLKLKASKTPGAGDVGV